MRPRLTAAQILGIMRRTAQPLPGADYAWRDDAGFGQIRPGGCIEQVPVAFRAVDLEHEDEAVADSGTPAGVGKGAGEGKS